ncbi:hypothetical protein A2853_03480 [Candidatus Kaiserbacteria bacterium RIFCSPHIGHO2_01_FULL_55_17]|uniref:Uncharacterized protein n=1 Tax=Candidatus Kaiserbacteria bacterium RIFCSPHIGHO2_01_FULL_55_17 TaxID=1798484 RepID=A0A1F6D9E3_9BACT|nr:MAG: hypothetical protein A2853_03480 [Candidatus Kaiserbacteria bacterium RIFCSPHIGHO2_01_FULL_55_17]
MPWLHVHPYLASVIGAGLLVLIGSIIVAQRSNVQPQGATLRVWGGVGANIFDPTSSGGQNFGKPAENLYTQVQSGPPFYYAPVQQIPGTQGVADDFDFGSFLAFLSGSAGNTSGTIAEGSDVLDAYSFIPQGLISTSYPERRVTPTQAALYDYGNEAGSFIQSFEGRYRDAPQILKDQFEDRYDTGKNEALLALANSLAGVGQQLERMENVPSEVRSAHLKVATSYQDVGKALSLIPPAKSDQAVIDAILAYNAVVETYVKNYVALATLFSAYGVMFTPENPGSVFTFTNVSL